MTMGEHIKMRINLLCKQVCKYSMYVIIICFGAILMNKSSKECMIASSCAPGFLDLKSHMGNIVQKEIQLVSEDFEGSDMQNFSIRLCTMEKEFYTLISENPIDKDLELRSDMLGAERIQLALKYQEAWKAEISHSLNILKEYLTEDDYQQLYAAYEGWEAYIENTIAIEAQIYYPLQKYGTGDGITRTLPVEVKAARIRDYAVLLMSLVYEFTETVEYVYTTELG